MKRVATSTISKPFLGVLLSGLLLAAGLASTNAAQAAELELRITQPERFADAGDGPLDRERNLAELESYLRGLAAQRLPASQKLSIELLDLNLAGEVQPVGRSMERLRVLRSVDWPSMELRFALSEGGKTLREGKQRLVDMNFLGRGSAIEQGGSDSLRYEKRMIEDWFEKDLAPAKR